MSTLLVRISQIATERPDEKFTSIFHIFKKEFLRECFEELKKILKRANLEFAEDKTRLIEFGRFANLNAKTQFEKGKRKSPKPDTFDFLGFTHYCGFNKTGKKFRVKRRTVRQETKKLNKENEYMDKNK